MSLIMNPSPRICKRRSNLYKGIWKDAAGEVRLTLARDSLVGGGAIRRTINRQRYGLLRRLGQLPQVPALGLESHSHPPSGYRRRGPPNTPAANAYRPERRRNAAHNTIRAARKRGKLILGCGLREAYSVSTKPECKPKRSSISSPW